MAVLSNGDVVAGVKSVATDTDFTDFTYDAQDHVKTATDALGRHLDADRGQAAVGHAAHGRAAAELVNGRRQVAVSYLPEPGYTGPDRFAATWEPGGTGVTVNVTVTP